MKRLLEPAIALLLGLFLVLTAPGRALGQAVMRAYLTASGAPIAWTATAAGYANVAFAGGTATPDSVCLDATNHDTCWVRDAANVMALKNSTNAQELRIYNSTTNTQYGRLTWASNVFQIDTVQSGGSDRDIRINAPTGRTVKLAINSVDLLTVDGTNGTQASASLALGFASSSQWFAPANGQFKFTNFAGSAGVIVDFGTDGVANFLTRAGANTANLAARNGQFGRILDSGGTILDFANAGNGKANLTNNAGTSGVQLDVTTDGTLKVRTRAGATGAGFDLSGGVAIFNQASENAGGTAALVDIGRAATGKLKFGGSLITFAGSGFSTGAVQVSSTQTTAPTCSTNCGTSPSVAGSDINGRVTMGGTGSPASGFVVTFNGTWASAPQCNVWMSKTGMATGKKPIVVVTGTTTFTVTTDGTAPGNSDTYDYHCFSN